MVMQTSNKSVTEVARDYVDHYGGVLPALAELLDEMEIAAGLDDNLSVNVWIEIARAILETLR